MTITDRKDSPKSPIKDNPLPLPGSSLRDELLDIIFAAMLWYTLGVIAVVMTMWEWLRYLRPSSASPLIVTVMTAIFVAFAGYKTWGKWRLAQDVALGSRGERAVAEALDELREQGYRIFHDLQEDGYNIDHVVIGPAGVFAIETKTRRKRRNQKVVFDGETILVGGHKPDRDPIAQARASAKRVRDILKQQTGRDIRVKPVVLFPGWWVTVRKPTADLFVGNEKYFLQSFKYEHSQAILGREEVDDLTRGLDRHVRPRG